MAIEGTLINVYGEVNNEAMKIVFDGIKAGTVEFVDLVIALDRDGEAAYEYGVSVGEQNGEWRAEW
jgi:hypothetical protein